MLLYYSYVPVELEPEYASGFCCDMCGSELFQGPLFHSKSSKRDLCVECGNSSGLSVFQGMVAALFFPSKTDHLFDEELSSIALFAFQASTSYYGVFFSCGSNLLFTMEDASWTFVLYDKPNKKVFNLVSSAARERFSWLLQDFRVYFDKEIRFHAAPLVKNNIPLVIKAFHSSSSKIVLELSNSITQVLLCSNGAECTGDNGHLVSYFEKCEPTSMRKQDLIFCKGTLCCI